MKLAFLLFHYFPYGGLERDMLALARLCLTRQHQVTIYTQSWQGAKPEGITLVEISTGAFTNHGRASAFVTQVQQRLRDAPVDLAIGFNKMPGLDVYYAADVCFAEKAFAERGWWYRWGSRCRTYLALEKAVFGPEARTQIFMISPAQIPVFKKHYGTADERIQLLPPGIRRDRVMPADYEQQRSQLRRDFSLADNDYLLLMVGSDFKRKGVARSIRALAALRQPLGNRARLWIAGMDRPAAFIALAQQLGVAERVAFLGARDDVPQLMWAADVFVHPAYSEAAGAVLLEAMVAGLPVITTDVCGYAHYVQQHSQGRVLSNLEADTELAAAIEAVADNEGSHWRAKGRTFAESADIFSMMDRAAEWIEGFAATRRDR